ncbi:acyl carrier protein [Bacillus halotolerans]|uniref:acyl carrier protein n=1 Tax=Bacillus subtilis group TaxID=653685 RepID=UPI000AE2F5CC|nr:MULTISPECIES: acyl carrier protein [Bacillus subtilis group]OTQ83607.1 hypothetical protein BG30_16200 [Bacillus subtilis subsp. subtilis]MDH3120356.1 acyl carrier protein [Bacillus subtilis]MEC1686942.1 acyl carrier protein [Bacillus mojavensis]WGD92883.1 acyl carrier protein [Bacillus subtilis]WGE04453.1 acyl carrier protein [Bacillus subtilis]
MNSTNIEIKEELKNVLAGFLNIDPSVIQDETSMFEDLGVDSTTIIEILLELEETFDVEFDVEDLEPGNLENVTSLSDYISELKKI